MLYKFDILSETHSHLHHFLIWFLFLTPGTGAQYTYTYDTTKTYYQQAASATTYAAAAQPYDTTAQSANPKVFKTHVILIE